MKAILCLILLAIVIFLVSLGLHNVPSFALLQFGHHSVAAPLWLALDVLIVVLVIMILIVKLVHRLGKFSANRQRRRVEKELKATKKKLEKVEQLQKTDAQTDRRP